MSTDEAPRQASAFVAWVVGNTSVSRVCVPRAPGGPVDLDRHPTGGGSRLGQVKRDVPAGIGKQPCALADDHWEREQGDLIDKIVWLAATGTGRRSRAPAARRPTWLAARRLRSRDQRRERSYSPMRGGESGRCHVFGLRVQRRPDRAGARNGPRAPGAGEDLVGPAAEQEGVGALVDLVHDCRSFVVEARPSASFESAALVLLRPAGSLHDSSTETCVVVVSFMVAVS